ncbi:MAG TPA: hypothetical protein VFR42_07765 [Candidatus Acidoferrum sp.]|nr:hypothetical protein [Candidatus Acidoferrum sp.]
MRPDFIISERVMDGVHVYIVLPTHTLAMIWMIARVTEQERHSLSAHLAHERLVEFQGDAALEGMTFSQPGSPQPAGGESTHGTSTQ